MQTQPSEKQFFRYVIPSMLTMLLMGFYAIIDGFFVGHAIGDTGLAAINLSWPIAAFLLAAGHRNWRGRLGRDVYTSRRRPS